VLGLRLGQRRLLPRQLGQLGIQAAAQLLRLALRLLDVPPPLRDAAQAMYGRCLRQRRAPLAASALAI
jgi:hypothetical protein